MAAFCTPPGVPLGEKTGYFHEGGVGGADSIGRMRIGVGEFKDVGLEFYMFGGREVWVRSQDDRIARIVNTRVYNDTEKIYSLRAGDQIDHTNLEAGQDSKVWFRLEVQVTGTAEALAKAYHQAFGKKNWDRAAELLNAFSPDDILAKIAPLTVGDLLNLEMGAKRNPRVGAKSNVAEIIHELVSAVAPGMYAQSVFPNNFGDKLGPVGGVVVGVAAGVLALRLAAPLLINYWRQITITMGMAKIAGDAEEDEAAIAGAEIRTVIQRLINSGGPQRVFVTYQSASPAADRELYMTSQSGQQYAQALAQGRNLYMLRIPERLYQVLLQRQLIETRVGSMYGQIGEDIRISPGAMQFLSEHFKQVPLQE